MPARRLARQQLRQQKRLVRHAVLQSRVLPRVVDVHATAEHADRGTGRVERSRVRSRVDAAGQAAHDAGACAGQPRPDLLCHVEPVLCRSATADDGDGRRLEQFEPAVCEQQWRRSPSEYRGEPFGVHRVVMADDEHVRAADGGHRAVHAAAHGAGAGGGGDLTAAPVGQSGMHGDGAAVLLHQFEHAPLRQARRREQGEPSRQLTRIHGTGPQAHRRAHPAHPGRADVAPHRGGTVMAGRRPTRPASRPRSPR
jgi:hypothetical protein